MSKTKTDVVIDEKVQQIVLEPEPVKVIMLNDDITPVDFVVELLIKIFKHTHKSQPKKSHSKYTPKAAVWWEHTVSKWPNRKPKKP